MKIGIVSCYFNYNYGSMLQAYATQKIIEKIGYEPVTFQCLSPIKYMSQSKIIYYIHKIENLDILRSKMRQYRGRILLKGNKGLEDNIKIRNLCFEEFYKKNIKLSPLNRSRKDLTNLASKMDAVIVGSDMLWHPINIEHDYYTLTFVPDNIKKISYATSFGTVNIPKYQKRKIIEFLNRFDSISVRESSGIDVIKKLGIKKRAKLVLDPTLLFSELEWSEIIPEKRIIKEKYIFCYFLGVNKNHREMASLIKEKYGYKIVALQHLDEYVNKDNLYADITPYDIGPGEFINLIKNAEYICTDSFHGTCFSILNHKKFLVFNRFIGENSQSTNSRIDSLLNMLNLESRRVTDILMSEKLIEKMDGKIDYNIVDEILENEREKSILYLKEALGKE